MSEQPNLTWEMRGLSFAARAVLATVTALTYELQETEIVARIVRQALELSQEAWEAIYAELYEAGALYRVPDRWGDLEVIEVRQGSAALRCAIGPGGRPAPKEWQELRQRVFEEHGETCFYCQRDEGPFEVDHVQPVTRGGSNHFVNLVPACKSGNSAKGNKTWAEWYPAWAATR